MKFIITASKNWTRVAFCAIAMASYSASYAQSATTSIAIVKQTGSFISKIEQVLAQFFNKDNNISYNECVIALESTLKEFENKIKQLTDTASDALSKKAEDIAQEARKHFNAAYSVIRQYNGKSASEAGKFKNDIERVFSPEIAFNAIVTKLRNLHKEAEIASDTELIHVIQQLMLFIEKKKTEWNNKAGRSLLAGLAVRMCR